MRWFIASAITVAAMWAVYIASPFWAARDLARALEAGDVPRIEARVNVRALRLSIARQLVAEALAQKAVADVVGGSEAQLAASAAALSAEPLLAEIVTPEGIVALFRALGPAPADRHAARPELGIGTLGQVPALVGSSRWRGFRTVYVAVPPRVPPDMQARLQFRLSRLAWRLVALDLPPSARQALVDELIRRRSG